MIANNQYFFVHGNRLTVTLFIIPHNFVCYLLLTYFLSTKSYAHKLDVNFFFTL